MATLAAPLDIGQKPGDEIRIQAAAVLNYRGGAASIIAGVGYATPLNIATAASRFIGVYTEGNDNSKGVAGTVVVGNPGSGFSSWVGVARRGLWPFNQSGLTQANVKQQVYFSDDNTVTVTPAQAQFIPAGELVTLDDKGVAWVEIDKAVSPGVDSLQSAVLIPIIASGAIAPRNAAAYVITKAGVAAETLAAPTAGTDDGLMITLTSGTAFSHTLTATGLLNTGSASVNVATFAAFAGAGLVLMAYNGKWNVISATGITFS
jgi:hypothetical protein